MFSRVHVRAALMLATLVVAVTSTPALATPLGYDLFETDPAATALDFDGEFVIPQGFFDPGSNPFRGRVVLCGQPIERLQGHDIGDADTVVRRLEVMEFDNPSSSTQIPIEIVQLNLQSCEPITVAMGATTQKWDVKVDLPTTQPTQGSMRINKTSPEGGTFSSSLYVQPIITFTNPKTRAVRVFDTSALQLQPTSVDRLVINVTDAPWRDGCTSPALAVPSINDRFCPGLTTTGEKRLIATSTVGFLSLGLRPVQPRVEHFECYAVDAMRRFAASGRRLTLRDQFGTWTVRVRTHGRLCNPARKNTEPWVNRLAHLQCYTTNEPAPPFIRRTVIVHNQFGSDRLSLRRLASLCLPSTKRVVGKRAPRGVVAYTDAFTCYDASSNAGSLRRRVKLVDQFRSEQVRVLRAVLLCAPSDVTTTRSVHPVRHLVCYDIVNVRRRRFLRRLVRVTNQLGVQTLRAKRPELLCVPSAKVVVA